jgi:uncharacterized membrane protein YkvA (DUF1232 family)
LEWLLGLGVALAVVVALWATAVALVWLHRPSRQLAGAAIAVLPHTIVMLRSLVADPATPRLERWLLIGLVAWLVSPIDLIPEFLPGIGALDDIVVAAVVLRIVGRRLGRARLRAHWSGTDESFALLARLL